jgi:hypothetical protein
MSIKDTTISLAGEWAFGMGLPQDQIDDYCEAALELNDTIRLPGTTGTNEKGPDNLDRSTSRLSQPHLFVGPCWYQREIEIPEEWRGKRVELLLERTKFTRVWFDGEHVGEQPWICTPHEYVLSESAIPGRHRLTVLVDNRQLPPFGSDAHQISDNTQGNWNGVVGRIELTATDLVSLRDLQAYPNANGRAVEIVVTVRNYGETTDARLLVTATGPGVSDNASHVQSIEAQPGEQTTSVCLDLGPDAGLWDEFHPNLIRVDVRLTTDDSENRCEVSFGLRDFSATGRHFEVNGRPIFLRGRHDGCVFPLTGHPPMDREGWLAYFRTCHDYGLNHVRFHTWTPPEAAFEAADELGFYLQPELPYWGDFNREAFDALMPEAERILRFYGNHPSFMMFSLGNEHWGGTENADEVIRTLKDIDKRRLYSRGTCAFWAIARPGPHDDYVIYGDVKSAEGESFQVRGANLMPWGHVQRATANTLTDYRQGAEANDVPTVSHEIGQYSVYPDFDEIAKYTGVTKPYNLLAFRDKLEAAGMLNRNKAFARASGALAAICYREEIEACLRTPEYGGFELLDLQDFPGQGTALVGILNSFMESKGILTPEEWRSFCAPMTLLARFPRYVWTEGDNFQASLALSHFGATDIPAGQLSWRLVDESNGTVAAGSKTFPLLPAGGLHELGDLEIPLYYTGQFTLELRLENATVATTYRIWVFSGEQEITTPKDVLIARGFDQAVRDTLAQGGRALIVCDGRPLVRTVGGGFAPDFWNFPMFHGKPGTMGLVCDPDSLALAGFPNNGHSDLQWASIAMASQPVILDDILPKDDVPIVQVIDNYARCHKLGLIFEFKVGSGSLLVCASDIIGLQESHPEARALLKSLIDYTSSDRFRPQASASPEALADLLRVRLGTKDWIVTASSYDPDWRGYRPEQIVDGNESRSWRAGGPGPAWCRIEFPSPTDLDGGEIVWASNASNYRYLLEWTYDGATWQPLYDRQDLPVPGARHRLEFQVEGAKAVRISIDPVEADIVPEIMEVHLFDPGNR